MREEEEMGRWGFHAYVGDNGDIYHEEDIYITRTCWSGA